MIKSRLKEGCSRNQEHWLNINKENGKYKYEGWYSAKDLADIAKQHGIILPSGTISDRINAKRFDTLWEAMMTPLLKRPPRKLKKDITETPEWTLLNSLFKVKK